MQYLFNYRLHELALVTNNQNNNDKIDSRAAIREKIEKIKQEEKTNKKIKNPTFVKICKFIFYLICLISLYIVVTKLLEKFGFTINPVEININSSTYNKSSINNTDEIPLKKFEITEVKQQNKGE